MTPENARVLVETIEKLIDEKITEFGIRISMLPAERSSGQPSARVASQQLRKLFEQKGFFQEK